MFTLPRTDHIAATYRSTRLSDFPRLRVTFVLLATFGLFAWFAGSNKAHHAAGTKLFTEVQRARQVADRISYLNEVLTMSARMATATGNMAWQARYDGFVGELDEAIQTAKQMSSPDVSSKVDETTRVSNDILVDLETRAFAAAHQGDLAAASAILNDDEYARHKKIYASGVTYLIDAIERDVDRQLASAKEHAHQETMVLIGVSYVLFGFWVSLAMTIFEWHRRVGDSETRTRRLSEAALEGVVIHDDDRIIDCNPAFLAIVGREAADLAGTTLLSLILEDHRVFAGEMVCAAGTDFFEAAFKRYDGTLVETEMRSRPFTLDGRPAWLTAVRDISERKRAEQEINLLAHYDVLTGLPNRALFQDRLSHALAMGRRHEKTLAILLIDLDTFKEVNDTLGHGAGDQLLVQVAERLSMCFREGDTLARLGGDEFALVVGNMDDTGFAGTCAQRIVDAMSEPFDLDGHEVMIGASVGIATTSGRGHVAGEELLRNADLALYRAKAEGRGTFRFFAEEMNEKLRERKKMERELRAAVSNGEFELHYQPQVDLATGCIIGVEALLRWRHPQRGLVPPLEFVPLTEETGLIVTIGEWVLRTACRQGKPWGDVKIAVNLSGAQFRAPGLASAVAAALAESGMEASRLELEVTETILMQDPDNNIALLERLKATGVRVVIDDFGSDTSLLSYLRRFPFDKIKIDRAFIGDVAWASDAAAIVRAILRLGHDLGITSSAEGVETEAQLELLRSGGCDQVQGFFISRPMPAEAVADFVRGNGRHRDGGVATVAA